MESPHWNDDELLAALRDALDSAGNDQVDLVIAQGQEAFLFASLENNFADFVYDSLLDQDLVGAVRGPGQPRIMVFESDALSLEVELVGDTVVGQLAPPVEGSVVMEGTDGCRSTCDTDALGCFMLSAPSAGPLRFHVSTGTETITTEWLS